MVTTKSSLLIQSDSQGQSQRKDVKPFFLAMLELYMVIVHKHINPSLKEQWQFKEKQTLQQSA
jgi:hypothetical protein